jgi:hypothetical protein
LSDAPGIVVSPPRATILPVLSLLALVTSGLALAGCLQPALEHRPLERHEVSESCEVDRKAEPSPRLHRFVTDLPFGEQPPARILSRGRMDQKSWLEVKIPTSGADGPAAGLARFWQLIHGALLGLSVLGPGVLAHRWFQARRRRRRRARWWYRSALAGCLGGAVLGVWAGVAAGSPVVIDNASRETLEVLVDGRRLARLEPGRFLRTRIGGRRITIEVRGRRGRVERIVATPDQGLLGLLRRATLGDGSYVYDVCGLNAYALNHALYGRE